MSPNFYCAIRELNIGLKH